MSLNQPVEVLLQLRLYSLLSRTVSRRVVLPLFAVAQPQQHSQAIRLERQNRQSTGEEQDLLRAGIAYAGKLLERAFGFCRREAEHTVQVAVELLKRNVGDSSQLVDPRCSSPTRYATFSSRTNSNGSAVFRGLGAP